MAEALKRSGALVLSRLHAFVPRLVPGARALAVSLLGGLVAGFLVGGIGGRIVMRLIISTDENSRGIITDAGFVAGRFTLGGTLELVAFVTFFTGFVGGVAYVLVRRWLPAPLPRRIAVYGLLLLLFTRGFPIDSSFDFLVFEPAGLSVFLFGVLPFLYAAVQVPIVERINRYVPALFYRKPVTVLGAVGIAALAVSGFAALVEKLGAIF